MVNPALIYASSSGWGQTGPYVDRPGQDMLAQAASGALFLQGTAQSPPLPIGVGVADLYTGLHIVIAILAAVAYRERSGLGQRVEVNLFSCITALQQQELTYFLSHGSIPKRPKRNFGSIWAGAPFGVYATADGHIVIAMSPCPVLAKAIDVPGIAKFDTNELMWAHRDEAYDLIAQRLVADTSAEWLPKLLKYDVWCAPVQDYGVLVHDPQLTHNAILWDVPVGDAADGELSFRTVGSPFTFSATPPRVRRSVPRVGQHTVEIFGDGLADA